MDPGFPGWELQREGGGGLVITYYLAGHASKNLLCRSVTDHGKIFFYSCTAYPLLVFLEGRIPKGTLQRRLQENNRIEVLAVLRLIAVLKASSWS